MNTDETALSPWALWRPYLLDLVLPFVMYSVVQALGASAVWALTAAGLAAAANTVFNTVKKRGLDALGLLVVLELVVSVAIIVFVRDQRLLLARPSFYTAAAAVYLAFSAIVGRPLTYAGSRHLAAQGGPARIAAYERAWKNSAAFRRTHTAVTIGFSVAFAIDSVLRVVIVYTAPAARAAWLSNVPHVVATVVLIGVSALAGRRFSRLVDEQMEPPAQEQTGSH